MRQSLKSNGQALCQWEFTADIKLMSILYLTGSYYRCFCRPACLPIDSAQGPSLVWEKCDSIELQRAGGRMCLWIWFEDSLSGGGCFRLSGLNRPLCNTLRDAVWQSLCVHFEEHSSGSSLNYSSQENH